MFASTHMNYEHSRTKEIKVFNLELIASTIKWGLWVQLKLKTPKVP